MINIQDKTKCSGCHGCASVCPQKCIEMATDEEGFLYPNVKSEKCNDCGLCEKVCPIITPKELHSEISIKAYASINNDDRTRKESSSGGVFTLLAQHVLTQGGVVFGAAFNERFEVGHIRVETEEELQRLRGSKYLQSTIGNAYKEAKSLLDSGRTVLFTGTPCQIGGLKAFLRKDYDNLYTQDLICHGVPSPTVWRQYLDHLEKKHNSKIRAISFRNKEKSWKRYSVSLSFENRLEITEPFTENIYMQAFLKNLSLRPSCYDCSFKGIDRVSDITLADFWGIESVLPTMDDDKGTSLIIVHSARGEALLDAITPKLQKQEVDVRSAVYENGSAINSSPLPEKRSLFFVRLKKVSFDKLVKKCTDVKFTVKVKTLIKKVLRRVLRWNKK